MDSNTDNREPTEKQRKFLFKLLNDAGMDKEELEVILQRRISTMDKNDMSRLIDTFMTYKDSDLLNEQLMKIADDNPVLPPEPEEAPQEQPKEIQKAQENNTILKPQPKPMEKPQPKHPFTVEKASSKAELMASLNHIPPELADMFFTIINGALYIKVAGLNYMAGKIGYARIVTKPEYDEDKKEWNATAYIYPRIPIDVLKALNGLSPDIQQQVLESYGPTVGHGRASHENVTNSKMLPFLKEMSETRALGRALRAFTAYGGTSYEELPDATIEVEK